MISRQRMEVRFAEVLKALLGTSEADDDLRRALRRYGVGPLTTLTSSARVGLYHLFRMCGRKVAILPAYNCRVVVEAARLAGLGTEFVDIDLATFNMMEDRVAELASPDSVIVATHQFGIPCDVSSLVEIAAESGAYLIEDCAAALGSTVKGAPVGSFGWPSVYSFEATKTLSLGRGGLIAFPDANTSAEFYSHVGEMVQRESSPLLLARVLLDPALTSSCVFPIVHRIFTAVKGPTADRGELDLSWLPRGRPTVAAWQARLGRALVDRLDGILRRRRELASLYLGELADVDGIVLPAIPSCTDPVLIRFPFRVTSMPKTDFYHRCLARGVDLTFTFSYTCHPDARSFPNSHQAASQVLGLPMYSKLELEDARSVVVAVRAACARD